MIGFCIDGYYRHFKTKWFAHQEKNEQSTATHDQGVNTKLYRLWWLFSNYWLTTGCASIQRLNDVNPTINTIIGI
jgi:hypothetical protein